MKPINAITVSAACLLLGACSINVDDGGVSRGHYDGNRDTVSVTLPSGEKDRFSCPDEMNVFVVDTTNSGGGLVYGCRSNSAELPAQD